MLYAWHGVLFTGQGKCRFRSACNNTKLLALATAAGRRPYHTCQQQ